MTDIIQSDGTIAWKYEDQTKIKHLAFKDYFKAWTEILGSWNNINYFDCFGGCGQYVDDNGKIYYGSPILAAEIISGNSKLHNKSAIIIIEKEKKYLDNLKTIFSKLKLNIVPTFIHASFEDAINDDFFKSTKEKTPAPSFFLVDPFGIKVKMDTLNKIMALPRSEILLNFMYNGVNRNLTVKQAEPALNALYGSEDWKKCKTEEEIVNCFKTKLKEVAKFVVTYRLSFPGQERTYYYLFHLSNHLKGASIMKDCFAKHNLGRVEYLGKQGNQLKLFDVKCIKSEQIKDLLLSRYSKKNKSCLEIVEDLIDSEPFLEKEICGAIRDLEKASKISISRDPPLTPTGRKRLSLEKEDIIIFS